MQIPKIPSANSINTILLFPILIVCVLLAPSVFQLLTSDMPALELESYFRDPASTIQQLTPLNSPFVGIYSQIGIILWFSAATIGIFTALFTFTVDIKVASMIFSVALIGLIFGVDDLFLVHERLAPEFLHVGENYVMLGYMLFIGFLIMVFGRQIWEYDKFFLPVACILLASSVGVDFVEEAFDERWGEALQGVLEDSLKLLGITAYWTGLFKISRQVMTKTLRAQQEKITE